MAYKTGNPALGEKTFDNFEVSADPMTLEGTAGKSLFLLLICIVSGVFGWKMMAANPELGGFILPAILIALVIAIVLIFKQRWAPVLAPVYAVIEGFAVGAISWVFNDRFDGIVLQALLVTGGIFMSMLVIYRTRLIRATENFKLGVAAATGGIFLYYIANLVVNFFGTELPLINSNSIWGILFSVFVVVLAAMNLVLDFDFIESGVEKKASKYMEWYAGFGLLVTIVWLYLEILRLMAKSRSH